jgi:DNA-binding CsgD family transcriptional regulator
MTPGEYLAKWRHAAGSIRKGATAAEVVRLHGISHPTAYTLVRLIRAGVKVEKNPRKRSGPGQGRKPIPAAEYLARWSGVVDALKAGLTNRAIKETTGACGPTVRHVMRFMRDDGWTRPMTIKKVSPKKERPPRIPKPPNLPMTRDERLAKYPEIVRWLRAGKTRKQIAKLEGVSIATIQTVRRAMQANSEIVESKRSEWVIPRRKVMTRVEFLERHSDAAFWLRAGKTNAQAAKLAGVSYSTVTIVKRAMRDNGEVL